MNTVEKKAFMLLLSTIFHYHGFDEEEEALLDQKAEELGAHAEMEWANEFIAEDYFTAFDRARDYLNEIIPKMDTDKRLDFLSRVWNSNLSKGFITEMEAMAMIKLAKDWNIEDELFDSVKNIT